MLELQSKNESDAFDDLFYSDPLQPRKPGFLKLLVIISAYIFLGTNLILGSYALVKSLSLLIILAVIFLTTLAHSSAKAKQIEEFIIGKTSQ
jgi:hypothetical protein